MGAGPPTRGRAEWNLKRENSVFTTRVMLLDILEKSRPPEHQMFSELRYRAGYDYAVGVVVRALVGEVDRHDTRVRATAADGKKICAICGEEKPLEEYHVAKKHSSGRAAKCKACKALVDKEYRLRKKHGQIAA